MRFKGPLLTIFLAAVSGSTHGQTPAADHFDSGFEADVSSIERTMEHPPATKEAWLAGRGEQRRQLAEMLGLDPQPPRGDLKATVTGSFEQDGIVVENLHYQPVPGLYVTANLYRPKETPRPLPTVLYLCGHADKKKDGVSYGNKTGYEHHGTWYAKHGFICLIIDTVQLGEIRGSHRGTYSEGRWDWISRGYTPAGVEAWSGIRGIDYLVSRPDVDAAKLGVTGRSGGGAYSWWVAALDERIACAVPTAGITTLRDHVVHRCVYGHCDCMFMVNTYRWDYDRVASLVAPRPLLIANTDKDPIFPIEGVFDIYRRTRGIYQMLGAEKNLGLQIAEGAHQDLQPLNVGEFHWMLRHLQGKNAMDTFDAAAVKSIPMEKLRVFAELPKDERNTTIDASFVPLAQPQDTETPDEWAKWRDSMMESLRTKVFAGWPASIQTAVSPPAQTNAHGISGKKFVLRPEGTDQEPALELWLFHREGLPPSKVERVTLNILDDGGREQLAKALGAAFPEMTIPPETTTHDPASFDRQMQPMRDGNLAVAYLCPRGVAGTRRKGTPKDETQLRRSFYLTGRTLESMQVWDIRAGIKAIRSLPDMSPSVSISLQASGKQAVNAIYASLFEEHISALDLSAVPKSHLEPDAPAYLNVLKYLDVPAATAMAAERCRVSIHGGTPGDWEMPARLSARFGWDRENQSGIGFSAR